MAQIGETTSSVCLARLDGGKGVGVRTVFAGAFGLISGCVAGIALFDHGPGMEFQPIAMAALVCAVAAPITLTRFRRGPGQPWRHGKNRRS
jgi:hypothetical protein